MFNLFKYNMIIWIASYPKSGNTWIRAMLSSFMYSKDGKFSFELLKKIPQFPLQEHLRFFTTNYWDIENISKYWISAQDKINLNNQLNFLKTHYTMCSYKNLKFTNEENTLAVIYIVRDPRNLVTSLSNHFSLSLENSKQFLFSQSRRIIEKPKGKFKKNNDVFIHLENWGNHYKSWKNYNKNDVLIVKYEDLLKNTKLKFSEILKFLSNYINIEFNEEKINNILQTTEFNYLKNLENQFGFFEAAKNVKLNKPVNFFNQGKLNDWQKLLNRNIELEITSRFSKEMKELEYLD